MNNFITVKNISHKYDHLEVLENISFELSKGETLCLLGPSGCGKSTLLQCISGFAHPTSGEIIISGNTVFSKNKNIPPEKRNIGLIFQDYALFPHLTVEQNIVFGIRHYKRHLQKTVINELIKTMHLEGLENKMPSELSGGQQQRVAIARALAPSPDIILFDEPFSNLDPRLRSEVRIEIKEILNSLQVTSIFVTHEQIDAFDLGDKVAILNEGVFHQIGSAQELYNSPKTEFVANFIGSGLFLPAKFEDGKYETPAGHFLLNLKETKSQGKIYLPTSSLYLSKDKKAPHFLSAKIKRKNFRGDHFSYDIYIDKLSTEFCNITSHKDFSLEEQIFLNIKPENLKRIF